MARSKTTCIGEGLIVLTPASAGPLEHATQFTRGSGGAEANVAIALAQLGLRSAWASRLGDDGFGRYFLGMLADNGVDTTAVVNDPARPTGMYVKELGSDAGGTHDIGAGRSRMHYYRAGSAASALSPAFFSEPNVATAISGSALIHTTGITPALSESALEMTLALPTVRDRGALLSFDLNWRPALWVDRVDHGARSLAAVARQSDIVFMGTDEALTVFGTDAPSELRRLFPEPHRLVVKDSDNLVTVFAGAERTEVPALRVQVVEAIGAGDAFAAGYLAGVLAGLEERASIRQGHLVAARTLTHHGDHSPLNHETQVAPYLEVDDAAWSRLLIEAA
jgi:2-dehydro-3-deoxygluconokinase